MEQSSNQKYCGKCIRRLLQMQTFSAAATAASLFSVGMALCDVYYNDDVFMVSIYSAVLLGVLTLLCNVATGVAAIWSLSKSFLQLRKVLRLTDLQDTPVGTSLRQAGRFAFLQLMGVSFSLLFSFLVVPLTLLGNSVDLVVPLGKAEIGLSLDTRWIWLLFFAQAGDFLGNAFAALLLSGSHRLPKMDHVSQPSRTSAQMSCRICSKKPKAVPADTWSPAWRAKVEELSMRGMTLRSLLCFYQEDLPSLGWRYSPKEHKTRDVVRGSIIPLTGREESSYALSTFNRDGAQRAAVMVTHNWGNCFNDLLAAVIADALHECSFSLVAKLLDEDCAFLHEILTQSGRLDDTYWICAFAVNQHLTICHSNPYDQDPLTDQLHPVCACNSLNIFDPDGRSTSSEINKFDDMMYHLASTGGCRQVIAIDQSLDLFNRAWCVAEIAEAKRLEMKQSLKLASKASIMQRAQTLENLDVRRMRAASETDKEIILNKIKKSVSIDKFNHELQALIFDPKSGLLASWNAMDARQALGIFVIVSLVGFKRIRFRNAFSDGFKAL